MHRATQGTQGHRSNLTGISFEDEIVRVLYRRKINAQARYRTRCKNNFGKAIVLNVFVFPSKAFPDGLGISATAQHAPGSGADKITHYVFNVCTTWDVPGVLIIESDNRDITPARDWAKSIVGTDWLNLEQSKSKNLLGVFTLREFETWLDCCLPEGKPISGTSQRKFSDVLFQTDLFGGLHGQG